MLRRVYHDVPFEIVNDEENFASGIFDQTAHKVDKQLWFIVSSYTIKRTLS
jgi:hypothetical protein